MVRSSLLTIQSIDNWKIWTRKISLFNLINWQPDIEKVYLYAKDPYEVKYRLLIKKKESTGLKRFNYFTVFIEYSNDMNNIYKNIVEYNPNKKGKY